ncbi:MAG: hypothetical protein J6A59_01495 [Lachnospiraceae bacterium]|nr:hypothetical protein [Lachnospiraceae bacterium]
MVTLKYITGIIGVIISIMVIPSLIRYFKLENIEETEGAVIGALGIWIEVVSLIMQLIFWQHNWAWLIIIVFILSVIASILLIIAKLLNNHYLHILDDYIKYRSYTRKEKIIYYKYITDAIIHRGNLKLYENKGSKPVLKINIKSIESYKYESIVKHLNEHYIEIINKS